jgi:RNA polymerase sigma-70 factor (ECF subfamily)
MPLEHEESVNGLLDRFLQTRRPEDFEPVVRLHAGQLYRVIRRIVHNQHDTEDLVQDTMLRAYEKIDTFRGNAKFSTWLCQIGVNLAISFLRRRKRYVLSDSVEPNAAWPDERAPTAELNEEVARVHRAIARLSAKLRAVLVLSVVEEMPIDEIAQILKCPKPTVYWRLHQARGILRRTLEVSNG